MSGMLCHPCTGMVLASMHHILVEVLRRPSNICTTVVGTLTG